MKKKPASRSAFFNPRVLIGFAFCVVGLCFALIAFGLYPGGKAFARQNQATAPDESNAQAEPLAQDVAQETVAALDGTVAQEPVSNQALPVAPMAKSVETNGTEGSPCNITNGGLNPQALTESGVAAPAGFFWSEVQHDAGNLTESNTSAGSSPQQGSFRLADNFTLSQPCTLNTVTFYAYQTGAPASPSPFTAYTLQIHNGRPGDAGVVVVFGDTTTNRLAATVDSTFFRLFNTAVPPPGTPPGTTRKIWRNTVSIGTTLPAGTYWLDWASTVSSAGAHFQPTKTIAGLRGAPGDNARQLVAAAWTDVLDTGNPATAPDVPQDFPFDIVGVPTGPTPTPCPACTPTPTPTPVPPTPTPTPTPTPGPTGTPCPGGGFTENFDGVTAPALPAGWVASNAQGVAPLWVTSIATPDTAPNSAFIDDPATVSDKRLDTPNITITSPTAQVSFRNNFALEPIAGGANFFDGGVLEVSSPNIAGGAFTDITNAAVGGSFVTGGYTGTISTVFMNPIGGRMAWSQSSGGYINTVANLGPNVNGQTIKLRFRMGSDNSVTGTGWRIDTIVVGACGPTPTPGGGTPTPTPGGGTPTPTPACSPTSQGFDDITTLPGLGWVQTNHSTTIGTTGWFQGNDTVFPAQGGAPTSYIGANFNNTTGTNTISNWLLTPPVGLQNGAVLTFWTRTVDTPGFPDRLQVRMSTNGGSSNVGTTATDVGDFTTLLLDINPTYTLTGYPSVWTQFTATVTGVPAPTTGRLAFRYFVENGGPGGANSDYIGIDTMAFSGVCGPTPTPGGGTPTPTPGGGTPTPTPGPSCPPVITHSSSQTITPGSVSCNGGAPSFFHADNSYWRAFNMATFTGGAAYNVTSVSFGIENAVANPAVGNQPVTVRLHTQTTGVFPGGTRTQLAATTVNVTNQMATVLNVPLTATVPAGTTELIMEVFTPDGAAPISNSLFIGSNAAAQTGPSYISAASCGLTNPTDVATIGFPNMHIVLNVNGTCTGGTPTPTPGGGTPTPTPGGGTPTPTPGGGTPTPTPGGGTATPTATPTPGGGTPTPTATPTPNPGPAQALNLATRLLVQGGDSVGIGGFIITGTDPKEVLIRGIGPSLTGFGVPNALADPTLELNGPPPFTGVFNNNWKDTQQAAIKATGIPPTNDLESAILVTLDPGAYTAILRGAGDASGVALVEIYDLSPGAASKLANIATRAFVSTGNDIVIAGFILGNGVSDDRVVIRGIGPSLAEFGVPNVLANPTLSLRNSDGAVVRDNDDWEDDPSQAALLTLLNLAPTNPLESGIVEVLPPGAYTALLAGLNNGTGNALVEVYDNPVAGPTPTPGGTATPTPTPGGPTPTPGGTATPTPAPPCTEAFDGVSAPALPAGWVATNPDPGDGIMFVTTITGPDTAPNAAFINDQDGVSDKVLDSRPITVNSATAQISFRNNFDTEFSDGVFWDGGVLEVSSPNIAAGEFVDITDPQVGGSFVSGAYTGEISGDASNPLAGRMAWSGSSGGYIDSVINLGANVNGQTITLRWRMGTDEAVVAPGWWVDTISFTGASCQ